MGLKLEVDRSKLGAAAKKYTETYAKAWDGVYEPEESEPLLEALELAFIAGADAILNAKVKGDAE